MKNFLFLLLLISGFAFGQNLIPDGDSVGKYGHPLYKLDTIVSSELSKSELYSNSLRWLSSNFKDSRNVIEMKDESLGEVIFSGRISGNYIGSYEKRKKTVEFVAPATFLFKCKIIVKDKKYRLIFNNLQTDNGVSVDNIEPQDKAIFKSTNEFALKKLSLILEDIIRSMAKKTDNDF